MQVSIHNVQHVDMIKDYFPKHKSKSGHEFYTLRLNIKTEEGWEEIIFYSKEEITITR